MKAGPLSSIASAVGFSPCHCLANRLGSGQLPSLVHSEGLPFLPPHGHGPCTLGASPVPLALVCISDTLWLSTLVVAIELSDASHLWDVSGWASHPIGLGVGTGSHQPGSSFGPTGVSAALPCTPRGATSLGRYSAFQSAPLRPIVSDGLVAASLSLPDCVVHTVHYIVWPAILAFRFPLILGLLLAPQFGLLLCLFLGNLSRHSLFNMASTSRSVFSSGIVPSQYDFGPSHGDRLARFGRGYPTGIDSSGTCPKLSRLERSELAMPKLDQVPGSPALMRRPGLRLIWCASASLSKANVSAWANLSVGGLAGQVLGPG